MSVNRNKPHLVVIQEDSPYRDLTNGIRNAVHVEGYRIDSRAPVGGWTKVLASVEDLLQLKIWRHCLIGTPKCIFYY
ncbi:MAG: hypothetical protein IE928_11235 [Gammaproteobacteria bacterium]|nr:hypothetical protein [Gammaproteobacteria bacterium]